MTYKKHRAVRTRDWCTCAVKYHFTQTLVSLRERTYLHLERALAVIQEDDAQPELGLFGDPGHGGEAAESPAPPLVLLHVRVSLRRSAKNHPSLPPSRELLQNKSSDALRAPPHPPHPLHRDPWLPPERVLSRDA